MGNVIETVLLGTLGSLLAAEIVFRHRNWCVRIINAAANRISDPNEREVRREEWLAVLNDQIGLYSSFKHAIGCFIGAPAVAAASRAKRPVAKTVYRARAKITIDGAKTLRQIFAEELLGQMEFVERMFRKLRNWGLITAAGASFMEFVVSFIKALL